MPIKKTCEVLVIGGGPGGYVAAIRLGQLGKKVILVEKQFVGGVCLNVGCIPSKALIYATDLYHRIKNSSKLGIEFSNLSLNLEKMQAWKDDVVRKLRTGVEFLCRTNKVEIIKGTASLMSAKSARVVHGDSREEIEIEFEKAILATGSYTIPFPGKNFDGNKIISSNEALSLKQVPKKVAVIGGGYIGIEIGTFFAKAGSEVIIIERLPDILMQTDRDLVDVVKKRKLELGAKIMANTEILSMDESGDPVIVKVRDLATSQESVLQVDKVFVAIGRKPLTEGLGLEKTKVEKDAKGFVKVNENYQTAEPGIYAIGDLIGNPMLAHKAFMDGKQCAEIIGGVREKAYHGLVPAVIFSDPEIAMVGISEDEAKRQGLNVKVAKFPYSALGRAHTTDSVLGFAKVIADAATNRILGIHIVGIEASSVVGEAALALALEARPEDLAEIIHPHPTFSELLAEASELMLGKSVDFMEKKK